MNSKYKIKNLRKIVNSKFVINFRIRWKTFCVFEQRISSMLPSVLWSKEKKNIYIYITGHGDGFLAEKNKILLT